MTLMRTTFGPHRPAANGSCSPLERPWSINKIFEYGRPCSLLDPTGTAVATFTLPEDPEWLRHARRLGSVAAIYGSNVGVQRPAPSLPGCTTTQLARAELHTSRLEGAVTWRGGCLRHPPGNVTAITLRFVVWTKRPY